MAGISADVGLGGVNAATDVTAVQQWLNGAQGGTLAVDGVCGDATVAAIKAFQATVPGVVTPDGLISPGGPTLTALLAAAGAAPGPAPAQASAVNAPPVAAPVTLVVDISHYQGALSAAAFAALAAANVGAVILKASEGGDVQDSEFKTNLAGARAAGLLAGAYHFSTGAPVADQVKNFLAAVKAGGGDFSTMIAALDVEPNGSDTITLDDAETFVASFKSTTRANPLVYGASNYLGAQGGANGRPNLAGCPLWIAAYPGGASSGPAPLPGWAAWTLWQYTDGAQGHYNGKVGGLACDQSIFRGTAADLAALWQSLVAPAPV
jgi:lysozyme